MHFYHFFFIATAVNAVLRQNYGVFFPADTSYMPCSVVSRSLVIHGSDFRYREWPSCQINLIILSNQSNDIRIENVILLLYDKYAKLLPEACDACCLLIACTA